MLGKVCGVYDCRVGAGDGMGFGHPPPHTHTEGLGSEQLGIL